MTLDLDALVLPAYDDLEGLPGEAEPWRDRYTLDETLELAGLSTPLRHDGRVGVVPTGIGKTRAATTTTALCASDALSLDRSLILSVGVGGAPPPVSVGSVVLADAIVDWDDKCRFDPGGEGPSIAPNPYTVGQGVYTLDGPRVRAARQTAATADLRTPARDGLRGDEPAIADGTNVCGDELWHGSALAAAVERLVAAEDRRLGDVDLDPYRVTEMEDAGTATALKRFGLLDRYLTVRGVSNHDRPTGDEDSDAAIRREEFEAGFEPAIENAVRVGSTLVEDWLDRDTD